MLSTMELIVALKDIALFAEVRGEGLKRIADALREMQLESGELLFSERDRGDEMYMVYAGKVRLFRERAGSEKAVETFGVGTYFGEMAIIDNQPRSASARAEEDSTLLVLRKRDFRTAVLDYPEIAFALFEELSRRLRHAEERVRSLKTNDADS